MSALLSVLAGGIIGLDTTSFPQAMISRPLVAGALAGWMAGIPAEGAMLGAVLEAFHLAILPIGASKYPESGTATAAAVFAMAWAGPAAHAPAMLLTVMFALGWERIGGGSVNLMRRFNERIAPSGTSPITASAITRRHSAAMLLDFTRGALVTVAGAAIGCLWIQVLASAWVFGPEVARGLLVASAAGSAAAALRLFGGWTLRWPLFVVGAVAGTLMVVIA